MRCLAEQAGAIVALIVAAAMNLLTWWGSDKAVLRMYGAQEVDIRSAPQFVSMVHGLADRAGMPRPKVFLIQADQPNAFATGRSPANAAVAATTGLLRRTERRMKWPVSWRMSWPISATMTR